MPVQNSNTKISAHLDLATQLLPLNLIAYCFKKDSLHISPDLQDSLLGEYLVITPVKSKFKSLHRNFCLF